MAYLAKDDYSLRIGVSHLDEILAQAVEGTGLTADNIRTNAEQWAKALVRSYLTTRYNIAGEYAIESPSADRNFQIMQIIIDLSLCTIHKTINPRDVPEHISKACEDAIKWLESARDGSIVIGVSGHVVGDEYNPARSFIGSQVKFISKPYSDASIFDDNFID